MARKAAPHSETLSADTRIALLVGRELFLQTEHTLRLRDALHERFGGVDTFRFDGQTTSAADVLDECRSFGLLQQHKMVVVDDADQLIRGGKKEEKEGSPKKPGREGEEGEDEGDDADSSRSPTRPMFERYAQAPTEGATLVLRAKKFTPGKLGPMIEKVGAVIKCEALTPGDAHQWVLANAPVRHGVRVDPAAADLLIERLGTDLGRLNNEVAKLAAAISAPLDGIGKGAGAGLPVVTADKAAELVGVTRDEDMWSIKDALVSGDAEAALRQLHAILDRSAKDQAVPVTWACLDVARQLHALARGLRQGKNLFSLSGQLKIWPRERADALAAIARRMDPARAAALLAAAVEADRRSKSGLGEGLRNLEVLAVRFASMGL